MIDYGMYHTHATVRLGALTPSALSNSPPYDAFQIFISPISHPLFSFLFSLVPSKEQQIDQGGDDDE